MKNNCLIFLCFLMACGAPEKRDKEKRVKNPAIENIVKSIIPLNSDFYVDNNSLLFCKESRWDTSYCYILSKEKSKMLGVYQEMSAEDDLSGKNNNKKLFFSSMISFEEDTILWNSFVKESAVLKNPADSVGDYECLDCSYYVLITNDSIYRSNTNNKSHFEKFSKMLESSIILPKKQLKSGR